jgi:hypothetical protein
LRDVLDSITKIDVLNGTMVFLQKKSVNTNKIPPTYRQTFGTKISPNSNTPPPSLKKRDYIKDKWKDEKK